VTTSRYLRALLVVVAVAASAPVAEASVAAKDIVRLPGLEVAGMPRTYLTITIPVPETLRDAELVRFDVRLTGTTEVLGRQSGELRPLENRRVVLTLRVPADALVGLLDVADILFDTDSGDVYVLPIILRIPAVRGLVVSGTRELRGLRSGDRVDLAFSIRNDGNAPDTLEYYFDVPPSWTVRPSGTQRLVVPARGRADVAVLVTVPMNAGIGDHIIALRTRPLREPQAGERVATVLGVSGASSKSAGLTLRPTVAGAASARGSATFLGLALDGPIAPDVTLSARYAPPPVRAGILAQGLSTVGANGVPFAVSASGRNWSADGGVVGAQVSDLTGANLFGQGATAVYAGETHSARAILARPGGVNSAGSGALIGAGYWTQTPWGTLGGSASRLEESGVFAQSRDLTAVGLDYRAPTIGTISAGGSLAYRSSSAADGVGIGITAEHAGARDRASLRVMHAPGGSVAFARARDELQLGGSRELTERWGVDASYGRSADGGPVFVQSTNVGWTVGQRYQLTRDLSTRMRWQENRLDARTGSALSGAFGADDRLLALGADWRVGEWALGAEGARGIVTRRTELLSGAQDQASTGRATVRADASRRVPGIGSVGFGVGAQFTGAGVGIPGRVVSGDARWNAEPMSLFGVPFVMTSSVNFQQFGPGKPLVIARSGARVALPGGMALVLSVEHNPLFRDERGRTGMVGAFSLTTATNVLSGVSVGPTGVVYEDRNGNGRRDPDEPGVGGVVLRRGNDRAVTDREGRYRFAAAARGRTRVDVSSVPVGLVAHPMFGANVGETRDVPLLTTGSVRVELRLTPDDDGRVPNVDLSAAVVVLRDAAGFEWVGRRVGETGTFFDGIPTGVYDVRLDAHALREPLRADDLRLEVTSHQRTDVVVPVRGRSVRIINPPSRSDIQGPRGGSGLRPGAAGAGTGRE
jgi:hypothetical protein